MSNLNDGGIKKLNSSVTINEEIMDFYKKANHSLTNFNETNAEKEILKNETASAQPLENVDPFQKFLSKLASSVETDKKTIKERQIKKATLAVIELLKTNDLTEVSQNTPIETSKTNIVNSLFVEKANEQENVENLKTEQITENEQVNSNPEIKKINPATNPYVAQLQAEEKKGKNTQKKLEKITDVKAFITKQVTEQINRLGQQLLGSSGGGGGTNAVQYADGGTMNGDLNVTGKYLSGGKDLIDIFTNEVGGVSLSASNRLISGSQRLILNQDGTISFPLENTVVPPDGDVLNLKSENASLNTFSKIVLSPYGFFAYDQNSNSITFNSSDNDIILTTLDEHEWKFDSEGILTGPNGNLVVGNIETVGNFVSGGKNLSTIIFEQSPYGMWLSVGNTGTQQQFLSSLVGPKGDTGANNYQLWLSAGYLGSLNDFLNSLKGQRGSDGLDGANNYQLWLSAGNTGTLTDFLSSIKGEKGDVGSAGLTGDSAYNIWLTQGNTGTITDFLSSLKGEKGATGNTVTNTDALTEGSVNLFFRDDRAAAAAPVKSVNNKTGDVQIGISDIPNLLTTLNSKQISGNYVELVNGLIPSNYIAGGVDEIQEYTNYNSLTSTGTAISNVLYVTLDTNKIYRWSGSVYVEIIGSPGSTDAVPEGSVNKYFTTQRASNAAPVQSVAGKTGSVSLQISDVQNLTTSLTSTNTTTAAITAKMTGTIGSYSNNSVIPVNTPFEVILRNLLTTQIPFTYTSPTLSVAYGSPSIVTTYEVGSTVPSFTITPTYTQRDGGTLVGYSYLRNGTVLGSGTTYNMSSFQITTTNTIQVSARYNDGPVYNDNLGNPDNNNIKAGSLINTITLNTLYPYFYGKSSTQPTAASIASAIQAGTATKVLADASGTVSITYNANGEFIWFAHLGTQTSKTKWFFTTLNSGDIGAGGLVSLPVTQNVTSPQGFWTNVQYKVYIGGYSTSTTGAVEFRN